MRREPQNSSIPVPRFQGGNNRSFTVGGAPKVRMAASTGSDSLSPAALAFPATSCSPNRRFSCHADRSEENVGWSSLCRTPIERVTLPHTHKHAFLSAHFTRLHKCGSRHFPCLKSHFVIGHVFAEHSFNPVFS